MRTWKLGRIVVAGTWWWWPPAVRAPARIIAEVDAVRAASYSSLRASQKSQDKGTRTQQDDGYNLPIYLIPWHSEVGFDFRIIRGFGS
jgi:hypothetical protein